MKTLHFIYLNNCFISIHVVIRFTHAYRDFVADNDYAILFKSQVYSSVNVWKTWSLPCTCWGTGGSLTTLKPTRKHLQLIAGNKKQFIVTKRFHLVTVRLSKDQRNQVFGVLKAGSTVNDIAHHFGFSRQTIHYLMNLYIRTGYVRVRARPGRARVTTLRSYRVNTLTHPRNRFKRQQLLVVFTEFTHIRLLVI